MKTTCYIYILVLAVLTLVACTPLEHDDGKEETKAQSQQRAIEEVIIQSEEIQTLPDGTKYLIHPRDIHSGGPPKDGIPSIDKPKFVSIHEADNWIKDDELILALNYKGEKRVYPLQILVWHEIVNDIVAKDPIAITYCPLCGSGIAYHRVLDGEVVEFGVSGKLYNSNLLMYDRMSDTLWTQVEGKAVVGERTGEKLTPISIDTTTWGAWKKEHPESLVLSKETGHDRDYGRDPYGSYYEKTFLMFPVETEDTRIHPKTVIYGIEVEGIFKAYRDEDLDQAPTIKDQIGNTKITVQKKSDGTVKVITEDGQEIVKERDFWFVWYAFHPETKLYGIED